MQDNNIKESINIPGSKIRDFPLSQVENAIKNVYNYKQALENLNKRPVTTNYDALKKYIEINNINISHFKKQIIITKERPLEEYLNNKYSIASKELKGKLIRAGYKKLICEICNQDNNWQNKKLPMILDHIDGNHKNNNLNNLRILCHNCNIQTENNAAKKYNQNKTPNKNRDKKQYKNLEQYQKELKYIPKEDIAKEDLEQAILYSKSVSQIIQKLNIKNYHHNYYKIFYLANKYSINTNHLGNTSFIDYWHPCVEKEAKEWVKKNCLKNNNIARSSIKQNLFRSGLKKKECEKCGLKSWQGKDLSFILDHVNGVNNDNRLENLRVLCPNCDACLDTYCGKNRAGIIVIKSYCPIDNKPIYTKNKYCSKECYTIGHPQSLKQVDRSHLRIVERPPYNQLKEDIETLSYLGAGKKYNVCDNTIRKWVKSYQQELNIDEEIRYDIKNKYRNQAIEKYGDIMKLYNQGLMPKEISVKLNIEHKKVEQAVQVLKKWQLIK